MSGDFNITHNVARMWDKAGVYNALYKSQGVVAGETIPALRAGLAHMEDHADEYTVFNPENGWGSYDGALRFLRSWLQHCVENPKATIGVWA